MIARTLFVCGAFSAVVGGAARAHAQSTVLTEAEVIRRARDADPSLASARARAQAAAAAEVGAGRYPNPELGWEREALPGAGISQDIVALRVPIALSGERAAARSLARAESAAAGAEVLVARSGATQRALDAFYLAIAVAEQAVVLEAVVGRLAAGAAVLEKRHAEGTASGYERTRIDLELALARSEWRETRARAEALRAQLAARLGLVGDGVELRGALDPGPPASIERSARPESLVLDARAAGFASQAHDDAASAWIPTLQVRAGLELADATTTDVGYVTGLSLELPLSSPGPGLRAEASARAAVAQARVAEREREQELGTRAARRRRDDMQRELGELDTATQAPLDALDRATQSGYREGQRSLAELLDAQRVRANVALRRIELSLAARQADVALRAARGEFE